MMVDVDLSFVETRKRVVCHDVLLSNVAPTISPFLTFVILLLSYKFLAIYLVPPSINSIDNEFVG